MVITPEPIKKAKERRRYHQGFTNGCNAKLKMLKRISHDLRNVEVYWRKMLPGLCHSVAISTQFDKEPTFAIVSSRKS